MGLEIAVDELYSTGWFGLDSTDCSVDTDGRAYPKVERVRREFRAAGYDFRLRHVETFGCYQAQWEGPAGEERGSVVGMSAEEAAVYALAQLRRHTVMAGA